MRYYSLGNFFGGILSFFSSIILIHMGRLIDRFPTENEEEREMHLEPGRIHQVCRCNILANLYHRCRNANPGIKNPHCFRYRYGIRPDPFSAITALVFSGATYNLMRAKNKGSRTPSVFGGLVQPGNLLRAFHLPDIQGSKEYSSRSSTFTVNMKVEE